MWKVLTQQNFEMKLSVKNIIKCDQKCKNHEKKNTTKSETKINPILELTPQIMRVLNV